MDELNEIDCSGPARPFVALQRRVRKGSDVPEKDMELYTPGPFFDIRVTGPGVPVSSVSLWLGPAASDSNLCPTTTAVCGS